LATGDEVIKFWKVKVKVGGEVCALLNALFVADVIEKLYDMVRFS